jgi:hypothetical protein
VVRYEVDGFLACSGLRRTTVADTIHMPDCIALYAFCKYALSRIQRDLADLSYSALHDGERLEQWLSSSKSNPVGINRKFGGNGQHRQHSTIDEIQN